MYVLIIVLFVIIFSIIYLPYFCPSCLPTMLKAPVHSAFPLSFCEQLKFQFIFPFPCISEIIYFVPISLKIHNYTNILKNDLFLCLLLIVINETNLFLVMFVSFHLCLTVILNHSPIIGGVGGGGGCIS